MFHIISQALISWHKRVQNFKNSNKDSVTFGILDDLKILEIVVEGTMFN